MPDFAQEREAMIERDLRRRGIDEAHILDAFREVPREEFVSPEHAGLAYGDFPLPIEAGQTISQPYIVALMIQAAQIGPKDRVLEVGAGSGYAAAIISRIAERVVTIERQHELAAMARERLAGLGYENVTVVDGDGTKGWPDLAPYDSILVAASGRHVPSALIDQLVRGGRLVMPVGNSNGPQQLIKVTNSGDELRKEVIGGVRFVPLIGEDGWREH